MGSRRRVAERVHVRAGVPRRESFRVSTCRLQDRHAKSVSYGVDGVTLRYHVCGSRRLDPGLPPTITQTHVEHPPRRTSPPRSTAALIAIALAVPTAAMASTSPAIRRRQHDTTSPRSRPSSRRRPWRRALHLCRTDRDCCAHDHGPTPSHQHAGSSTRRPHTHSSDDLRAAATQNRPRQLLQRPRQAQRRAASVSLMPPFRRSTRRHCLVRRLPRQRASSDVTRHTRLLLRGTSYAFCDPATSYVVSCAFRYCQRTPRAPAARSVAA